MDVENFNKGIIDFTLGSTNEFHTAIGSEFFFTENPRLDKDVIYPYGVFQIISGVPDRDSLTKYEKPVIQVTFYSDDLSAQKILQLGKKFIDLFDDSEGTLTVSGYKVISVDRMNDPRILKSDGYWQYSVDYTIELEVD